MITILYVDDEANTSAMQSRFDVMKADGIDVVPVYRVEDALPTLRANKQRVQALVLDIIMPPLTAYSLAETNGGTATGLRLLRDIRADFPALPVIVVSVRPRSESRAVMESVSGYLRKPVDAAVIVQEIKRVVARNRS